MPAEDGDVLVYQGESMDADPGAYCADCGEPTCDGCGPQVYREYGRVFASGEYLEWWTEGMRVPALATTSTVNTPRPQAGELGQANTRVLFGDQGLDSDARSGARFKLGLWLDPCRQGGVEVTYMTLSEQTRQFQRVQPRLHDSRATVLQHRYGQRRRAADRLPQRGGWIALDQIDHRLQGMELLWRRATRQDCYARDDFLIGYRWAELTDKLRIDESTVSLETATAGDTIRLFDQFDTRNSFHGVELGLSSQRQLLPLLVARLAGQGRVGQREFDRVHRWAGDRRGRRRDFGHAWRPAGPADEHGPLRAR